ncbi:MAG: NapC/NirT family cytochrome c [Gammaproteobacteria bacterium]|nr:NapC/NirT family cytochrome c [Gammaproteobacteria bacterium]
MNSIKEIIMNLWRLLKKPTAKYSLGTLLVGGFIAGIIFWGGFNTAMEMTNNEQFCISCHEMRENVYEEYKDTIHYANRTGVRATCPDCHVPKEWAYKVVRKIKATNELFHKALGTIDTPEKFESKRLHLARNVWKEMKDTDSRECRNCHDFKFMDYTEQGRRGMKQHQQGLESGKTCIDCHKGIAHSLPAMYEVDPSTAISH